MLTGLWQDCKIAVRGLRRNWAFTVAALAALTLGLGANTAIFSVVDAVLIRPLPYPDAPRLVMLQGTRHNLDPSQYSNPTEVRAMRHWMTVDSEFDRWQQRTRGLERLAGWSSFDVTISGSGDPQRLRGGVVTPGFFQLFNAHTTMGRTFALEENRPGEDRVIILGHGLWQRSFGGDRGILGHVLQLDGVPHTIIGVMEPRFHMVLVAPFAALALLLAAVGIYGVIGCSVAQRTREFGIRMAIGASRASVLLTVMREALLLTAVGVAIGVAAALAASRFLASLLFGVKLVDPVTFSVTAALLFVVGLLAAWLPARRAVALDPMAALRYE